MADQAEVIRQQMEDTRASMTEKIEALEKQVSETVKDTTQTVSETVDVASETVSQTVNTISETVQAVRETFDIPAQIEKHPWIALGGALAIGYVLGMLLTPSQPTPMPAYSPPPPTPPVPPEPAPVATTGATTEESHREVKTPGLSEIFGNVRSLAIGTAVGVLGEVLLSSVPTDLKEGLSGIVKQVTESLGGRPQHQPNSAV